MIEVPGDFPQEWRGILAPIGKRSLVIAGNGTTSQYSRGGRRGKSFPSHLPGGFWSDSKRITILDCIFDAASGTFFILDVMMWADYDCYDLDTEFRHFWVKSKFEEVPKLSVKSNRNPYEFVLAKSYDLNATNLREVLKESEDKHEQVDGLLLYHKRVNYLPGHTPLVGWLKAYMVPDMFGVSVPESFMKQAPSDYQGLKTIGESYKIYQETRDIHKGNDLIAEEKKEKETEVEMQESSSGN